MNEGPRRDSRPGLLATVREDFRTHREGLLAQGFWALMVYRFSHPRGDCRFWLLRKAWAVPNLFGRKFIEVTCGISIPESVEIGRRLNIEHFGGIVIHGSAVIGDDCILRQGVTLGNRTEQRPMEAPRIGNRVQIGAGAKILGNVTVGDDAVIGANAVILQDVPPGAIAVGIPARILPR